MCFFIKLGSVFLSFDKASQFVVLARTKSISIKIRLNNFVVSDFVACKIEFKCWESFEKCTVPELRYEKQE